LRADLEVEFLVVGGGPVGSALALQLRRAGREVLLVDGGASPSKVCGEGLLPAAWEVLEELGVAPLVAARAPIRELTYQLVDPRDGRLRAIRAGLRHPSYGVRREVLCAAFAQAAREEGLEVWRPARFRSLQLEVAGCRVELELPSEQGGARRVACRYLLGADGLHSSVRRAAGLANPKPGRFARWGSRVYMRAPAGSGVVVTLGDGLECYQTPLDEGLCGLAFIWSPRLLGRPLPGEGPLWSRLLARFPPAVRDSLPPSGVFFGSEKAIGPLQQQVLSPLHPGGRVALLGDAAGYLDALTGEGLCLGLLQARALARLLLADRLQDYPRAHRAIKWRHQLTVQALLHLFARPALRERAFRGLQAVPGLLQTLVRVAVEQEPWYRLLGPDLVRFARHALAAG
jgi:2-polyprenyl-6-methoxyphenol hydroxylase-like FAD-dependent oxidoreductase